MKLVDNANIVLLPNNVGIIFYVFSMKTVCPLEWFVEHEIRSNDCYKFCEKGKNYNTYKNYEMWKRFEYGNCKKKYIHAWLNWLTMQTKRINIKTNVWCYDFKVRYKNQRMLPTGHWLWIFYITISIPKKIYLNKYVDVKKANFTQKPISHSMEKHAAHLSSAYFDFLSRYIKHV